MRKRAKSDRFLKMQPARWDRRKKMAFIFLLILKILTIVCAVWGLFEHLRALALESNLKKGGVDAGIASLDKLGPSGHRVSRDILWFMAILSFAVQFWF